MLQSKPISQKNPRRQTSQNAQPTVITRAHNRLNSDLGSQQPQLDPGTLQL